MSHDYRPLLELARRAALEAGEHIASCFGRKVEVRFKGPSNPVTEVDLKAQEMIRSSLLGAHPEHGFLGEEGNPRPSDGEWLWIVDPLDGTKNFSHGYPHVAVSIGLEYRGQMVVGVVHDPLRKETFEAIRGEGAFLNRQPIEASEESDMSHALLMTGFSAGIDVEQEIFRDLERRSQGVRRDGSAALDLCYVAAGRLDGFLQLNLSPWDVAAGGLIVQEAQGMVSDYRGRPFSPRARQIVASNVKLHRALLDSLKPHVDAIERWLG